MHLFLFSIHSIRHLCVAFFLELFFVVFEPRHLRRSSAERTWRRRQDEASKQICSPWSFLPIREEEERESDGERETDITRIRTYHVHARNQPRAYTHTYMKPRWLSHSRRCIFRPIYRCRSSVYRGGKSWGEGELRPDEKDSGGRREYIRVVFMSLGR